MEKSNRRLDWCVVHLGENQKWWVKEISDVVNWDVEGLSIIDPNQFLQIHESLDSLTDYGLLSEIVDDAFFTFEISEELEADSVRLSRVRDSLLKAEDLLFALPDIQAEEKGPYADFIKHITQLRVQMLNEIIDFPEPYTVDDLEEILRERESTAFLEGRHIHFHDEITSILEFAPDGFKVEADLDEDEKESKKEEEYPELETVEETPEEEAKLEKQENLRWDEDEPEEEKEEKKGDP
tara:strand:- start:494 stop:1207 length:714 start_codon:yes stop_codon:yes gene_type:complete